MPGTLRAFIFNQMIEMTRAFCGNLAMDITQEGMQTTEYLNECTDTEMSFVDHT